jgi:hypothetical protein
MKVAKNTKYQDQAGMKNWKSCQYPDRAGMFQKLIPDQHWL